MTTNLHHILKSTGEPIELGFWCPNFAVVIDATGKERTVKPYDVAPRVAVEWHGNGTVAVYADELNDAARRLV